MGNEQGRLEGEGFGEMQPNLGPRTSSDPQKRTHKHKSAPKARSKLNKKKRSSSSSGLSDQSTHKGKKKSKSKNGSYDSGLSEHDSSDFNSVDSDYQKSLTYHSKLTASADNIHRHSDVPLPEYVQWIDSKRSSQSGFDNSAFFDASDQMPDKFSAEAEAEIDALEIMESSEQEEDEDVHSEDGSEFSLDDIPSEDEEVNNTIVNEHHIIDTNFNKLRKEEVVKSDNNGESHADVCLQGEQVNVHNQNNIIRDVDSLLLTTANASTNMGNEESKGGENAEYNQGVDINSINNNDDGSSRLPEAGIDQKQSSNVEIHNTADEDDPLDKSTEPVNDQVEGTTHYNADTVTDKSVIINEETTLVESMDTNNLTDEANESKHEVNEKSTVDSNSKTQQEVTENIPVKHASAEQQEIALYERSVDTVNDVNAEIDNNNMEVAIVLNKVCDNVVSLVDNNTHIVIKSNVEKVYKEVMDYVEAGDFTTKDNTMKEECLSMINSSTYQSDTEKTNAEQEHTESEMGNEQVKPKKSGKQRKASNKSLQFAPETTTSMPSESELNKNSADDHVIEEHVYTPAEVPVETVTNVKQAHVDIPDQENVCIPDDVTLKSVELVESESGQSLSEFTEHDEAIVLEYIKLFVDDIVLKAADELEHEIMNSTVKNVVDELVDASVNLSAEQIIKEQEEMENNATCIANQPLNATEKLVVSEKLSDESATEVQSNDLPAIETSSVSAEMGNVLDSDVKTDVQDDIAEGTTGKESKVDYGSSDDSSSLESSDSDSSTSADAEFSDAKDELEDNQVEEVVLQESTDDTVDVDAVVSTKTEESRNAQEAKDESSELDLPRTGTAQWSTASQVDEDEKLDIEDEEEQQVVITISPAEQDVESGSKPSSSAQSTTSDTDKWSTMPEIDDTESYQIEDVEEESQSARQDTEDNQTADKSEEKVDQFEDVEKRTLAFPRTDTAQWSTAPQVDEDERLELDDEEEEAAFTMTATPQEEEPVQEDTLKPTEEVVLSRPLSSLARTDTEQWSNAPEIDETESYNIEEIEGDENDLKSCDESFYSGNEENVQTSLVDESMEIYENESFKTGDFDSIKSDEHDVEVKALRFQPTLSDIVHQRRDLLTPTESATSDWSTKVEMDEMENQSIGESNLTTDNHTDDNLSDDCLDVTSGNENKEQHTVTKPIVSEIKDTESKTKDIVENNQYQAGPEDTVINNSTKVDDFENKTREERMAEKGERLLRKKQKDEKESIKWKTGPTEQSNYGSLTSLSLLSRKSSGSDASPNDPTIKELKEALSELEDKYKQAMVQNAQLDNEKAVLNYRVETMKDLLEEQDEELYRLRGTHKSTCQALVKEKRLHQALEMKMADMQEALRQRDELIQGYKNSEEKCEKVTKDVFACKETIIWKDKKIEALMRQLTYYKEQEAQWKKKEQGLVLVGGNGMDDSSDDETDGRSYALVSQEAAQVLESAGEGPLNQKLKHIAEERNDLLDEVRRLRQELEEERNNNITNSKNMYAENGVGDMQLLEIQRDASRQISEYKFKLQKSEQDTTAYQANIARLENQLQRIKATSEALEKSEDEMRAEKRKLQRDLRATLDRMEELEMTNSHLEKRLERVRAQRNTQS